MTTLPEYQRFKWAFELSNSEALQEVVDQIKLQAIKFEKCGIYLLTSNSGANSSVEFWKGALEHGVDFANPRNFPWTLASCPAGYFARLLNIQGPNYTLIGGKNNLSDLTDLIEFDLETGLINKAIMLILNWATNKDEQSICIYSIIDCSNLDSFVNRLPDLYSSHFLARKEKEKI